MIDVAYDASRRADVRRGLTMIELLITMSIVAILASMVLFAMSTAQESARAARTEATIATLHALVMEQYESYQTRRLPEATSGSDRKAIARTRLHGIRTLMQVEMPDRWSDVTKATTLPDAYQTALTRAYNRRYSQLRDSLTNAGKTLDEAEAMLAASESAECLYMFITFANPEARSLFSDNQIGDTDGDGAPEFLDGWGRPINFIRWPAGFQSDLQSLDGRTDPDPFDPMKVDPNYDYTTQDSTGAYFPCRLVPLIYSAGPDKSLNLLVNPPEGEPAFTYPVSNNVLDPFAKVGLAGSAGRCVGAPASMSSSGHIDNIHNHLIGAR